MKFGVAFAEGAREAAVEGKVQEDVLHGSSVLLGARKWMRKKKKKMKFGDKSHHVEGDKIVRAPRETSREISIELKGSK